MPIYTYQCDDCGVRFDKRQKFADDPLEECPECKGHVHRVPQPVGIVFKGSGWYSKDSKSSQNLATPGKRDANTTDKADTAAKTDTNAESATENRELPRASGPECDSLGRIGGWLGGFEGGTVRTKAFSDRGLPQRNIAYPPS